MKMKIWSLFVAMYFSIDAADSGLKPERVNQFLSFIQPWALNVASSADPAYYSNFSQAYANEFGEKEPSERESLEFVRRYLSGEFAGSIYPADQGEALAAFDAVANAQNWASILNAAQQEIEATNER